MIDQLLDTTEIEKRQLNYATFWIRLAALLIDIILLIVVESTLAYFFGFSDDEIRIASVIIAWLYFAGMESSPNQGTIGKVSVGIQVGNENGDRISFVNATGRWISKIFSAVILGIGFLMMLWDEKKQTLHDKMARTFVFFKK